MCLLSRIEPLSFIKSNVGALELKKNELYKYNRDHNEQRQ